MKRPHILITNDDGIHAPGIKHLWNALKPIADLSIVAPTSEQSGVAMATTFRNPLRVDPYDHFGQTKAWGVNGTPADCVKLALSVILETPPDLIVSGINRGSNAGRNVMYSGTVAGVIEGVMHDIPGIAVSCWDYFATNYSIAEEHLPNILRYVLEHPLPYGTFLNVNFPSHKHGMNGFKLTRQGKEYWAENPDKRQHPAENLPYYWMGIRIAEYEEEEDCDISWLKKGYAAVVPVHVGDLTDDKHLNARRTAFDNFMR